MNNEQKYFLDLISSEINGTKVEIYNVEIDWNEIYRLAKIHSLIAITFSAINKLPKECNIPLEIYEKGKEVNLEDLIQDNKPNPELGIVQEEDLNLLIDNQL